MTLTGNNAITLRKLTSKVAAEKDIPLLKVTNNEELTNSLSGSFCILDTMAVRTALQLGIGIQRPWVVQKVRVVDYKAFGGKVNFLKSW